MRADLIKQQDSQVKLGCVSDVVQDSSYVVNIKNMICGRIIERV